MSWAEDSRSACFRSALAFCSCSAYMTSRHDSGSSAASPASWTVPRRGQSKAEPGTAASRAQQRLGSV